MFDLEREIQRWRQESLTHGLSGFELDELEDHLRADIEEQLRSGVAAREAFAIAVKRLGPSSLLHLLLALTIHDTGVLAKLLEQVGLARGALRKEIENQIKASVAQELRTRLPCTHRLNKALRLAANEAASGRKQINAGYVLVGLLRERTGVAGNVLRSLGFNAEQVRSSLA